VIPSLRTALVLLATFTLVAVGCGSDDASETSLPGSPPTSAAPDTTVTPSTTAAPSTTLPDGPSPAEPGDHAVGRRTITLVDEDRDGRALAVDLWYPADAEAAAEAPAAVYSFIPGAEFTSEVAAADVPVADGGPYPLVIYSHGSSGQRFVASDNAELLASHGFVVAAPDHVGNTAFDAFLNSAVPQAQNAANRPADTAFVITELLAESATDGTPLAGAIDPERIGLYGHSFGGYTALAAVSGRGDIPPDDRIVAVIAQAPVTGLITDAELESVDVPTMLQSGTRDRTVPLAQNTERPWELVSGRPLYRVDIIDGGHQSFTDVCDYQALAPELPDAPALLVAFIDGFAVEGCAPELIDIDTAHDIIDTYTLAFLLTHVAGDTSAEAYLTPEYAETIPQVAYDVKVD
jgi:predicted dienelactone hydrolase